MAWRLVQWMELYNAKLTSTTGTITNSSYSRCHHHFPLVFKLKSHSVRRFWLGNAFRKEKANERENMEGESAGGRSKAYKFSKTNCVKNKGWKCYILFPYKFHNVPPPTTHTQKYISSHARLLNSAWLFHFLHPYKYVRWLLLCHRYYCPSFCVYFHGPLLSPSLWPPRPHKHITMEQLCQLTKLSLSLTTSKHFFRPGSQRALLWVTSTLLL